MTEEESRFMDRRQLSEQELQEVRLTVDRMTRLWRVWGWLANAAHDWKAIAAFVGVLGAIWGPDVARALASYMGVDK